MEKKLVQKKEDCCGCGTCALVCPTNAISMEPEELGCLYPKIDSSKCIHCHACEKVCAFTKERSEPTGDPKVFAAVAKDRGMLKKSASGGVFAAVAHGILDAGGIVYGCSLETVDGELTPLHIGVETHEDLEKLQGSKYVQSSLGTVFLDIKQYLHQGRLVLFSGTPCQVDALKHYLKNTDTQNLYTMDLICHGVPSAELFCGYLSVIKKRYGEILDYMFRDKKYGWGYVSKVVTSQKHIAIPSGASSYINYFLESELSRECCYFCRYANTNRVGDITVGDYWGIEQEHSELLRENSDKINLHNGVSSVLINNDRGRVLWEKYGKGIHAYTSEVSKVKKWNRQLRAPSSSSRVRHELTKLYNEAGYSAVEKYFRKEIGLRYFVRIMRMKLRAWRSCNENTILRKHT